MKFSGMSLPMGVAGTVPSELLVFPVGEPPPNDERKWRFLPADLAVVAANFAARPDPMPIFWSHGEDPAKGRKAAGWVDSVFLATEGLFANVRWTDEARAEIRSGAWGFRSPGFEGDEDEEGFIHPRALNEVSLVNDPAIGGMDPVHASTNTSAPKGAGREKTEMANDPNNVQARKAGTSKFDKAGILALLRDTFAFPEAIDDKTLSGLVANALMGGAGGGEGDPMMPAAKDAPPVPLTALTSRLDTQERELAALKTSKEVEAVIEEGVKDLRLTPALVEVARTLATHGGIAALKAYTASLKPTAPPAGKETPAPESSTATPSPFDFIGHAASAFEPNRFAMHRAAIAFLDKSRASGNRITYRDAVIATTRKSA